MKGYLEPPRLIPYNFIWKEKEEISETEEEIMGGGKWETARSIRGRQVPEIARVMCKAIYITRQLT